MKLFKKSIVTRVTLWYSFFILSLTILIMIGAFLVTLSISQHDRERQLKEEAVEMVQNIEEDYEPYDDGVYFEIHDADGNLVKGQPPKGFSGDSSVHDDEVQEVSAADETYQFIDLPIEGGNRWLRAIQPKHQLDEDLVIMVLVLLVALPLMMVVVITGGYYILKNAFKPVSAITKTAESISQQGDFSQRVVTKDKGDELTDLAGVINKMLASVEAAFKREQQLTSDVSHELRTPIAVILSESEFGERYATDLEESKESFDVIRRQALGMRAIVEQVLALARFERGQVIAKERINLSDSLRDMLTDRQQLFEEKGIKLESTITSDLYIQGDQVMITRLLDNLLSNAMKFTTDEVVVSLALRNRQVVLGVADNGPGISQDEQDKIWNRFYQIDQSRHRSRASGIGLGLSLVKSIADLHQAKLKLQSLVNKGSLFEVSFEEDFGEADN